MSTNSPMMTPMSPMHPYYTSENSTPETSNATRSISLISFGVTQLTASILVFCYCTWILSVDPKIYVNFVAIFFCFFHLANSFLAIAGGLDFIKARCVVVFCLVLGLTAMFIKVLTIFPIFYVWARTSEVCAKCSPSDIIQNKKLALNSFMDSCRPTCNQIEEIFLPLTLGIVLQGLINCIICSIAGCIICRCGNFDVANHPERVIHPHYTPLVYQIDSIYTIPPRYDDGGNEETPFHNER